MNDDLKPPAGLGAAGKRFWREVTASFEPSIDETRLLEQASRTLDEISALELALKGQPALVPGSRGQTVANPLYAELRGHRALFARLCGLLALNDSTEASSQNRSQAARKLALLRYQGRSV